jgi:hypothetical protein
MKSYNAKGLQRTQKERSPGSTSKCFVCQKRRVLLPGGSCQECSTRFHEEHRPVQKADDRTGAVRRIPS